MSLVIITLESPEEAIGFAGGVEFVNDSAIEVVSVEVRGHLKRPGRSGWRVMI